MRQRSALQLKTEHDGRKKNEHTTFLPLMVARNFRWNLLLESICTRLKRFVYELRQLTETATFEVVLLAMATFTCTCVVLSFKWIQFFFLISKLCVINYVNFRCIIYGLKTPSLEKTLAQQRED